MVGEGVFSTGAIGSYCAVADVLSLLIGYDLTALGDQAAVEERAGALLPQTALAIETAAGREFHYHANCEVELDGSGTERLSLEEAGATPVVELRSVRINGVTVPLAQVVVEAGEGSLRLRPGAGVFSKGSGNVAISLDWGFAVAPSDIATAQAKLTAAEVLGLLSGSGGLAESVKLGDYEVRYGAGGANGEAIRSLTESALRIAARYRRAMIGAV